MAPMNFESVDLNLIQFDSFTYIATAERVNKHTREKKTKLNRLLTIVRPPAGRNSLSSESQDITKGKLILENTIS